MKIILFSIVCLFLTSCDDNIVGALIDYSWLDIELQDSPDENGYYHIEYEPNATYRVYYDTTPLERVYWGSPDNFSVEWQGFNFEYPIINYSTYADDDGNGVQLYYLDNTMIGDTLSIFGYLDNLIYDGLMIIVDDNN